MKKTKKFEPVKVETFNTRNGKRQYIVARKPNGRIDQRRPVKGTRKKGLLLKDFKSLYKNQKSLFENRKRDPLRNVTQLSILSSVKLEPIKEKTPAQVRAMSKEERKEYKQAILPAHKRKPIIKQGQRGKAQYIVEGYYNGKYYSASSKFKGAKAPDGYVFPDSATSRACKESAWENLFKLISRNSGTYDADEGLRLVENQGLQRVKEGWVFYTAHN